MTKMINKKPIQDASNLWSTTNPPYDISDFFKMFPQFEGKLDTEVIELYIDLADQSLTQKRWGRIWKLGMANFVAHFCAIHIQHTLTSESEVGQLISISQAKGLISSKSAGDVSVSYDFGPIMEDLKGYSQWKLTTYGIQFASFAKMIGKGGVYIW